MRGYGRDEIADEYEEYDDYADDGYGQEEEGEEEEEEYVEEEDPKPTKEELEYLELRQRLKEQIKRQLMKKEGGSNSSNSNEKKRKLPYDNYGSFFGPSQPVIAQRVIQESKSLLETDHLTPKVSNSLHTNKKSSGSLTGGSRPAAHDPKTKVKNQFKTKVQKLKDTRDYSFLLSEDAELPAPSKVPPPRNVPVRNSEARPAQVPARSKQALGSNGRLVNGSTGHEERKSISINGHLQSKVGSNKVASASKPNSRPLDPRRQLGNNNGTGPGRPFGSKGLSSKLPATTSERRVSQLSAKTSVPSLHRPVPSKSQSVVSKKPLEQRREQLGPNRDKLLPKRPAGLSRPQVSSGLSRPQVSSGLSRPQVSSGLSRPQVSSGLSRPQVSSGLSRPQVSSGLSRPQTNRPQKPISSHQTSRDNRPKKKPVGRYSDDEDDNAFKMLRQMFRYDPNKYADRDDDLSDMEANFDDIMREERQSEIIARKEDEEELRKIEEEERRERMAKLKKFKKQRLE